MFYKFSSDNWGARFEVPACLVTDYIKICDGNYVKVLLCVLCGCRSVSTETIAQKSGVSEKIVDEAVQYWVNEGVLSSENVTASASVQKPVIKEPVSIVESIKPTQNTVEKKVVVNYSQREIREKAENDANLKQLVNDIQSTLQFSINGKELGRLVELYELYHFDVPTILLVAEYCSSINKPSIAYLSTVMIRWFDEDITSYADVERKIISCSEFKKYESQVLRKFGVENKPSKQQAEFISKWNKYHFSIELIEIAYNKCMDAKSKLNFNYIDGILMKWAEKSISTPEQVAISDSKFNGKFKSWENKNEKGNKETSYDLDEFEEFAMNFNPNKN